MHRLSLQTRSIVLLFTVLLFFVLTPLLENDPRGEVILVLLMYLNLAAATMLLSGRRDLLMAAIPIAASSMALLTLVHFYPSRRLVVANGIVLAAFLGLTCVSLFAYLGREGENRSGRIYASVSLYFLLALTWFALYGLTDSLQPGSFTESGTRLLSRIPAGKLLYFSLATLTTVGYGDMIPVRPAARMLATLEAAAGVLYIAITVARLVASYQSANRE